ncbi:host nuclease inhibitor GamL [Mixta mediterraneensis]|uniref:host nuclease inhibitor GamL n=1 Tax=Mixta mediterraneensis TaxID=2758443 RepID=UPI001874A1D5|nr:host nuclease inhibitor GamL [Mixta mediterraneensis]MBE5254560.1 host nuclease inhibitor GamL [Mixta mediterraneensis]
MNRFATYDRIQQHRDDVEAAQVRKDEWIRDKSDQLSKEFPQCVMEFYRPSSGISPYRVGLDSDEAQDAYAEFVEAVCLAKAKHLYEVADFMGEVA